MSFLQQNRLICAVIRLNKLWPYTEKQNHYRSSMQLNTHEHYTFFTYSDNSCCCSDHPTCSHHQYYRSCNIHNDEKVCLIVSMFRYIKTIPFLIFNWKHNQKVDNMDLKIFLSLLQEKETHNQQVYRITMWRNNPVHMRPMMTWT